MSRPRLSVVVPVFGNAGTLEPLAARVAAALDGAAIFWQLVLVDDRSPDDAGAVAARLAAADPRIAAVRLPENRGQHRALLAGFAHADGEWIAALDADLQDPPEALPKLLAAAVSGHDLVFAGRRGRYESPLRLATSRLFKGMQAAIAGVPADAGLCFVAARPVVERALADPGRDPWLVVLLAQHATRVSSLPVERAPRAEGTSSYTAWDRWRAGWGGLRSALRSRAGRALGARWAGALGAGLGAALIAFLLAVERPFGFSDEGYEYLLSRSWARGERIFERFAVIYPPGQHVWLGSWMRLFGEGVWVLRWGDALLAGLAGAILWWALERRSARWLAALAVVALATVSPPGFRLPAMLAVFAAALSLAEERPPTAAAVAGLGALAGLLAGWREDCAVLMLGLAGLAAWRRRAPAEALRIALPSALAGFAPWLILAALRGEAAAWADHTWQRLTWVVERLAHPTTVPWRAPAQIDTLMTLVQANLRWLSWTPLALYLAVLAVAMMRKLRGRPVDRAALAAACVGIAFSPQFVWERRDIQHLRLHLPVFIAALAVLAPRWPRWPRWAAAACLAAPLVAAVGARAQGWPSRFTQPYPAANGALVGARTRDVPPWAGLPARPGETLIVLGWGPGWYALEDVPPGTRHLSQFLRSLPQSARAELAADVARPTNRWVIEGGSEYPAEARLALRRHYRVAAEWAIWRLWQRLPREPPAR